MQVLVVTVAEAQAHLPELIARINAGDQVVIAEGGKSVARLTGSSMFATTPEEEAERQAAVKAAIREMVKDWGEYGVEIPPDSELGKLLAEEA